MLRASPVLAAALIALMSVMPLTQVHATTQTFTFGNTATFDHIMLTVSGTITVDTVAKTITGTITVKAVNDTSGQTIFQKTFMIFNSFAQTVSTNFVLMIPAINLLLSASCSVTPPTGAASCMVSKNPDVANQGTVNIVDVATIAFYFGTTNAKYDLDGNGVVDIVDVAIAAADFGAPVIW